MSIYKPCDIRGPESELSPSLYRSWGRVLGGKLEAGATFLVGGDVRRSTPIFCEALIEGLCQVGMRVIDLGTVPTPMAYFGKRHLQAEACAIVTASHSPPEINGLKWMVGDFPPSEEEVQELQAIEAGGKGAERSGGTREEFDIAPEYQAWLQNVWGCSAVGGRVILDPGSGCWSGRAKPYLEGIFPGVKFTAIHDRADGLFRERNPDSSRPEHLRVLSEIVRKERADMGIAFDGDGDRVAFIDAEGWVLLIEETTWILVQSFGKAWEGRNFIHDIKCSDRIAETVAELGGVPVPQRSGHAFIRTSMIETEGLFGAEVSGHFFYGELDGGDDGLFSACRMLNFLEKSRTGLMEMCRICPSTFTTPDLRLKVEPSEQDRIVEGIKTGFREYPQGLVDGVRVEFEDGWALARKSVTAPELTFRFEGKSEESLERIIGEFCKKLPQLGTLLLEKYAAEKEGGK